MSESYENRSLEQRIEALIFASDKPLSVARLQELLECDGDVSRDDIRAALIELGKCYQQRGIHLVEVGSGFRFQTINELSEVVGRLWEEKPQRYSRALLETLALIAYRQPITRGDIEEIRGVAVSSNIIKSLLERHWVRVVGHREVPGRPAIYATTRQFLDYFNLKSLDQLPSLAEIRDLDTIAKELTAEFDFEAEGANEEEQGAVGDSAEHTAHAETEQSRGDAAEIDAEIDADKSESVTTH